jgi:hypothetical protein
MSNMYVIQWKSKLNGRAGRGTKLFEREEGEELVQELNEDYPDIEHELINTERREPGSPSPAETPPGTETPSGVEIPSGTETSPGPEATPEEVENAPQQHPHVISFDASG